MDHEILNLQKKNYLLEEVRANPLYPFLRMAKPKLYVYFIVKYISMLLSPTLHIVALNSASAWSISPALLIFMLRFCNKIHSQMVKIYFKQETNAFHTDY